jgi:hypothetical protein
LNQINDDIGILTVPPTSSHSAAKRRVRKVSPVSGRRQGRELVERHAMKAAMLPALRASGTRRASLGFEPIEAARRLMGAHLRDAIMPEEPLKPPIRLRKIWPAFAIGFGLLATLVWTLFLGWLLGHALVAIF